jgi:hypothetical protein
LRRASPYLRLNWLSTRPQNFEPHRWNSSWNVSITMRHGKRNNSWSVRLLFRHSQHSAMRVRCSAVSRASSDAVRTASSAPCWSSAARQVSHSLWRRSHRDGVPLRASSVAASPAH